jgi:hypothetical protein
MENVLHAMGLQTTIALPVQVEKFFTKEGVTQNAQMDLPLQMEFLALHALTPDAQDAQKQILEFARLV